MSEKLSDSWRGWVRTHADGADREYGYVLCTITASLELELAQAQADVEALQTMVAAYTTTRMDRGYVEGWDELDDAYEALPEHLRGAKEQEGASLAENR